MVTSEIGNSAKQMVRLQSTGDGVLIPIRARAGARRNAIEGEHDGMLKVSVTAAPEKGKANKAIVALLSDLLGVPRSSIEVVAGATSDRKRILVLGATMDNVRAALDEH